MTATTPAQGTAACASDASPPGRWEDAFNASDIGILRIEGLIHALAILRQHHEGLENPRPETQAITETLRSAEDALPVLRELRAAEWTAGLALLRQVEGRA